MKTLTKKGTILKRILSLDPIVSVLREAVEGTSVGAEDGITFGEALGTAEVTLESEVDRISAGILLIGIFLDVPLRSCGGAEKDTGDERLSVIPFYMLLSMDEGISEGAVQNSTIFLLKEATLGTSFQMIVGRSLVVLLVMLLSEMEN